jgi:hypothetical protein
MLRLLLLLVLLLLRLLLLLLLVALLLLSLLALLPLGSPLPADKSFRRPYRGLLPLPLPPLLAHDTSLTSGLWEEPFLLLLTSSSEQDEWLCLGLFTPFFSLALTACKVRSSLLTRSRM